MVSYQANVLMWEYSSHLLMQNGWTVLQRASLNGHHKIVKLLLTAGANPDVKDEVTMGVYPVKHELYGNI